MNSTVDAVLRNTYPAWEEKLLFPNNILKFCACAGYRIRFTIERVATKYISVFTSCFHIARVTP